MQLVNLLHIKEERDSLLRKEFDELSGEMRIRDINIFKAGTYVDDLENHPEICSEINIIQVKKIDEEHCYSYFQRISTNNEYLDKFEQFLRGSAFPVQAEKDEKVPDKRIMFFKTPYTQITCDVHKYSPSVNLDGKIIHAPDIDVLEGVDVDEPFIFQMIEPEVMHEKLSELEKNANYSIEVKIMDYKNLNKPGEFVGFEYRNGNQHKTTSHFLFRG